MAFIPQRIARLLGGRMTRKVTFTPRRFRRKIWELENFDISRDGRVLAYSANKGDQYAVYLRDLRTGRDRVVGKSREAMFNPEFSPDGKSVAMQADFEGNENSDIYVVPTKGGAPKRLTDDPMDDASPRWSPDGRWIAFISNRWKDRENVFVMPAEGGEPRQLTTVEGIVGEIAWRPDGRMIAFNVGVGYLDWVGLVDLEGHMTRLVEFPDSENVLGGDYGHAWPWSPDGRELAFQSSLHDHLDIGAIDIESRTVRWLVETKWDKAMPNWSPDGKGVAFLENRDGDMQLRTVPPRGGASRLLSPATGCAAKPRWDPTGKGILYEHSTSVQPPRLIYQKGARRTVLVNCASVPVPRDELAEGKVVRYKSFDGLTIPAFLYVPKKARYRKAVLVEPHGGPEWLRLNEWDSNLQFLVAEGFAMLFPNFRGSTGYGRKYRRSSDRDLGGADMKDILAGARFVLEKKLCPPDRLGIVGVSYGGYAVAHCLEQAPDLWAAGVSIVGFFDWMTASKNERGNLAVYDRWKMGNYETDEAHFRRYSPRWHLDRIRAPVLFTGGMHDPRCPVTEARQMFAEMKNAGKTVEYLEFPDEGHRPRKMENKIKEIEAVLRWFNRYLPDA